jgi:hypothetical protein
MPGIVNHPYDEREVLDRNDEKIGRVEDAYVDRASGEPVFLLVAGGLFGAQKHFVPVTGAELVGDDQVRVAYDGEMVKTAPSLSPMSRSGRKRNVCCSTTTDSPTSMPETTQSSSRQSCMRLEGIDLHAVPGGFE